MVLTKPLIPVWIFMLEVFGRDRDMHSSTFGCHHNADSYRDLTPNQIYKKHENKKKWQYDDLQIEILEPARINNNNNYYYCYYF